MSIHYPRSGIECSNIQAHHPLPIVKQWYAIYVRSRHEKCVQTDLRNKGIESSLPFMKVTHQWSDRRKKVEVPLFRGYVFVRLDINKDKLNVLQTDGVVKFIGIRGKPSRIPDEQMRWIHMMVKGSDIIYNVKEIPLGKKVRVMAGPFKGVEGVVISVGNQSRLVIVIESIIHAVSIEINPNYLENIKKQSIS